MRARSLLASLCAAAVALTAGAGAWAATQVGVTVGITATSTSVLAGQQIRVAGTAGPSPTGSWVHLQVYRAGAWRFVSRDAVDSADRYAMVFVPATGSHAYRTVRPPDAGHRLGVSRVLHLTADRCDPLPAPSSNVPVWFSTPTTTSTSLLTRNLSGLFCAAAPHSTVRISLFFLYLDHYGEVEQILRSLELVHRYRDVRVHFLLEWKSYLTAGSDALARLRRFSTVELCYASCRSAIPGVGILHDKTVTVSDMTWKSTRDPVLVSSTANWSFGQLRRRWQSTQLVIDDPRMTREFDIRWDSMRVCGTSASGCAAWPTRFDGVPLPAPYRLTRQDGVWVDPALGERTGTRGRGLRVLFTPQPTGLDPVAAALARYRCTALHHTVRIAMFRVSIGRGRLASALAGLRSRGCDVRIVVDAPLKDLTQAGGLAMLRERALSTTCATNMHDKYVYLDVVRADTGAAEQAVWGGSHNYTWASLYDNDESMLSLTLQSATGAGATGIRSALAGYASHWNAMAAAHVVC